MGSRIVAWTLVSVTGAYVLLSGGNYSIGHSVPYWALIATYQTAGLFALLCIPLTAALFLRFVATRREPRPDGLLPVTLAAGCTLVAILRALSGGLSHGDSVELDGHKYHLAFDVPFDRDDRCILFECGSLDVMCASRLIVTRYMAASSAKLKVGDQPHTVSVYAGQDFLGAYSTPHQ